MNRNRIVLVVMLSLATGCGPGRSEQCAALIEKVNAVSNTITRSGSASKEDSMSELAKSIDRAKSDLVTLRLNDRSLRQHRDDYLKVLERIAASAREMSAAATKKDLGAMREDMERIQAAGREESTTVASINRDCHRLAE